MATSKRAKFEKLRRKHPNCKILQRERKEDEPRTKSEDGTCYYVPAGIVFRRVGGS